MSAQVAKQHAFAIKLRPVFHFYVKKLINSRTLADEIWNLIKTYRVVVFIVVSNNAWALLEHDMYFDDADWSFAYYENSKQCGRLENVLPSSHLSMRHFAELLFENSTEKSVAGCCVDLPMVLSLFQTSLRVGLLTKHKRCHQRNFSHLMRLVCNTVCASKQFRNVGRTDVVLEGRTSSQNLF